MNKIITLYFLLLSFCLTAQVNNLDVKALQDEISKYEKAGDNYSNDYANLINTLGIYYTNKGMYNEAEPILVKVSLIRKNVYGVKHLSYATSLNNLAFLFQEQNKYYEAELNFIKALEIYKELLGENNKQYATFLNNLAFLYFDQSKYIDSETLFSKVVEIRKNLLGEKNQEYLVSLNKLGQTYFKLYKYTEALILYKKCLELNKELFGEKSSNYLTSSNNISQLYIEQGKYNEAEIILLKTIEIASEINDYVNHCESLKHLSFIYELKGSYLDAENLLIKCLKIVKENFGENNSSYSFTLSQLAILYKHQGKFQESETILLQSLDINRKVFGDYSPYYANDLWSLGQLFYKEAKYKESELYFLNAIEIINKTIGERSSNYAGILGDLATLYHTQDKNLKSEKAFLKSLKITEELQGKKNINYTTVLNNLNSLYVDEGKYYEAEISILELIEINKELLGEDSPSYLVPLGVLAYLYHDLKKYDEAEFIYLKLIKSYEKKTNTNQLTYATILHNLSVLYEDEKKYSNAVNLNLKAFEIYNKVLDSSSKEYIDILRSIAYEYYKLENYKETINYLNQFLDSNHKYIIENIYGLSEQEIINFSKFEYLSLNFPPSFLIDFPLNNPEININCYENKLLLENLSIKNHELINKSILKSNNNKLIKKLQDFRENHEQIKKIKELTLDKRPSNFQFIVDKTEQLEKELTNESISFAEYKKGINSSFNDIKFNLKGNEISINVISFSFFKEYNLYAAFIIKKDSKFPKLISLFQENQLDFLLSRNKTQQDSTRINKQYLEQDISDLFLKPLEEELKGISVIYLSSSGLGHQIDFAALPLSKTQNLGEKHELHILNVPAELIGYKKFRLEQNNKPELLLYGGINYGKSDGKEKTKNDIVFNIEEYSDNRIRSGIRSFDYIDGTNKEVNQIHLKGTQNGFSTKLLNESAATEESIKALDGRTSPYVLHLATHGFFFEDPINELPKNNIDFEGKSNIYKMSDDPMLRSGLVFAGANNYWNKYNENSSIDDGILTASEISNLDLSACQLVVLSACETGLGEVKGSEGVFGLQRAFKMAGVKNIIMSLWKVPDTQTAALFDIFYSECFAGKTIHEAFQSAQAKMKANYSPYYWAGFVLLE